MLDVLLVHVVHEFNEHTAVCAVNPMTDRVAVVVHAADSGMGSGEHVGHVLDERIDKMKPVFFKLRKIRPAEMFPQVVNQSIANQID